MQPVASIFSKADMRKHLTEVLRVSTGEGFAGKLIFNTSGFFVKLIAYYDKGGSKLFPEIKYCYPPSKAKSLALENWINIWQKAGGISEVGDCSKLYLEVLEELGLMMSMGQNSPFEDSVEGDDILFCFTDGVSGLFFYLGYNEALEYSEKDENG